MVKNALTILLKYIYHRDRGAGIYILHRVELVAVAQLAVNVAVGLHWMTRLNTVSAVSGVQCSPLTCTDWVGSLMI